MGTQISIHQISRNIWNPLYGMLCQTFLLDCDQELEATDLFMDLFIDTNIFPYFGAKIKKKKPISSSASEGGWGKKFEFKFCSKFSFFIFRKSQKVLV